MAAVQGSQRSQARNERIQQLPPLLSVRDATTHLAAGHGTDHDRDGSGSGHGDVDIDADDGLIDDDVQSIMQPALSAAATHLTLAKTPAAEKAAAMDRVPGGAFFDQPPSPEEDGDGDGDVDEGSSSPGSEPEPGSPAPAPAPARTNGQAVLEGSPKKGEQRQSSPERKIALPVTGGDVDLHRPSIPPQRQHVLPSPWRSSPTDSFFSQAKEGQPPRRALESISWGQTRQKRSGSAGAEALKRLSKALPSLPNPSNFFSSVSFFSSSSSGDKSPGGGSGNASSPGPALTRSATDFPVSGGTGGARGVGVDIGVVQSPPLGARAHSQTVSHPAGRSPAHEAQSSPSRQDDVDGLPSPTSVPTPTIATPAAPERPLPLRRTTSDDSLLYHSLSRVSSLGDDDRFENVREMANVRMKAIRDSLPDRPSFKMPSLPKFSSSSQRKMFQAYEQPRQPRVAPIPETQAQAQQASAVAGDSQQGQSPIPNHGQFQSPKRQDSSGEVSTPTATDDAAAAATALDRVLEELTGDLVIMGGYRGSILRSAESPHPQLWAPVKVGLNMRKADLEVGLEVEDEETMEERIIASGMLQNIGPIDISRKFFKRVRSCENARSGKLRVWDYGYDWRLSPHRLSRRLVSFLEGLPSNRPSDHDDEGKEGRQPRGALVIAHSLGGMITRHAVNQRPELFSGVVYVGTPQRCINILGPIRNGDAVLFNEKILTAHVNFSLRTSFVFLPEDGFCFVDKETKEEYPIDFFDARQWVEHRLSPSVAAALPALNPKPKPSGGLSSMLRSRSVSLGTAASDKRQTSGSDGAGAGAAADSLGDATRKAEFARERKLNPQLDSGRSGSGAGSGAGSPSPFSAGEAQQQRKQTPPLPSPPPANRARNVAYLERTLADTKRFRSELAHSAAHSESNAYPPIAIMYGKSTPTVYAAKVTGREGIGCVDAYDDLVFRPGDGVVLAREAQAPPGYELVRGGRVRTERGHLTMLGDMPAIGKAIEAVVRGRRKGIGLGPGRGRARGTPQQRAEALERGAGAGAGTGATSSAVAE